MDFKDYYKILGVKADADAKEIKAAYRKLARKYHPDMNSEEGAEDKFKEAAEAYEVLKDAGRRAEFDDLRKYGAQSGQGFRPPPGWQQSGGFQRQQGGQSTGDFSDFFNSMFGGGQGFSQSGSRQQKQARGQDVEVEIQVALEETLGGTAKTVEYRIPATGSGEQINKHLKVTIPKGVTEGERIRLKGQGKPCVGKGPAGDLYLHIRIVPHQLFDVQGHNLILTVPITPWEAALGTKVTIPTLVGSINVTIAPNSPSGKKLRIKGKGLQGKTETGDLYAVLKIVMPASENDEANVLWKKLSETVDFDPRAEWSKKK